MNPENNTKKPTIGVLNQSRGPHLHGDEEPMLLRRIELRPDGLGGKTPTFIVGFHSPKPC